MAVHATKDIMKDKLEKLIDLLSRTHHNHLCNCHEFVSYKECKGCPADSRETLRETINYLEKLISGQEAS